MVVRRSSDGREKFDTKVHIYDRGKFLKNYAPLMSIVDCFSSNMCWSGSFHDCYPFAPFAFFHFGRRPSDVRRTRFKKVRKNVKVSGKNAKLVLLAYEHCFGSKKCHIFQWCPHHDHILHIAGSRAHGSIFPFYLLACNVSDIINSWYQFSEWRHI